MEANIELEWKKEIKLKQIQSSLVIDCIEHKYDILLLKKNYI